MREDKAKQKGSSPEVVVAEGTWVECGRQDSWAGSNLRGKKIKYVIIREISIYCTIIQFSREGLFSIPPIWTLSDVRNLCFLVSRFSKALLLTFYRWAEVSCGRSWGILLLRMRQPLTVYLIWAGQGEFPFPSWVSICDRMIQRDWKFLRWVRVLTSWYSYLSGLLWLSWILFCFILTTFWADFCVSLVYCSRWK